MNKQINITILRSLVTETFFPPPVDDTNLPRCTIVFGDNEYGWNYHYKPSAANTKEVIITNALNQVTEYLNKILALAGDSEVTKDQLRSAIKNTEFWEIQNDPNCDPDDDCDDFRPEIWCAVVTDYGTANAMEYLDTNPDRSQMTEKALGDLAYHINTIELKWLRGILRKV